MVQPRSKPPTSLPAASRPPAGQSQSSPPDADRLTPAWIFTGAVVLLGLPAALALGASRVPWSELLQSPQTPHWLAAETVRASTANGDIVKASVALDAPDDETRRFIERQHGQVALLMQFSVAEFDGRGASGSERVQRLSAGVRTRLNDFLVAQSVPPVREVVIQDLVWSKH